LKATETAEQRRDRFARMGHTGGAARVPKGFAMMSPEQVQAASAKGTATRRANAAARAQAKQDKWAAGEIKQGTSK